MILCHKCQGLLEYDNREDVSSLLNCQCISGWVRGFEPMLNREQAIAAQIKQQEEWITLYRRQERAPQFILDCEKKIEKLRSL